MYTIALLLVCLVCAGEGRRVQMMAAQLEGSESDDQAVSLVGPLQALATLLTVSDGPHAGYQVPGHMIAQRSKPRAASASLTTVKADEEKPAIRVSFRGLPDSALALDCNIPKDFCDDIHMKTMAKLAQSAEVPGFRKGKVPPEFLVNQMGVEKAKEATIDNMVKIALQNSNVEKDYPTVGEARLPVSIEDMARKYKLGEPINFTIEIDIMPSAPVNESKYKGLTVKVPREPFNQDAYDKALLTLRKKYPTYTPLPAGTVSEMGNELRVNMIGFYRLPDGTKGDPLPAIAGGDDIPLPLEAGQFMPGLVEGVVGMKEGETRQIEVTFPRRSKNTELNGKEAIFDVECLEVMQKELPEADDEFANSIKEGMTWKEMDEKIREEVNRQSNDMTKDNTQRALSNAIVATLPDNFSVPMTLVQSVQKERFAEMLSMMRERGASDQKLKELVTPENYKVFSKITKPQVAKDLKANMAIDAIAIQQGLQVDKMKVEDELMNMRAVAQQQNKKFKESESRDQVVGKLHRDMVFDYLESQSTVNIVDPEDVDVEELMGANPEQLAQDMAKELQKEAQKKAEAEKEKAK